MRHYTKSELAKNVEIEEFIEQMQAQLNLQPVRAKEAKIMQGAIKSSLRHNRETFKVHLLNIGYTFARHPDYKGVPQEILGFVGFLESNQDSLDWNSVIAQLEVIWRSAIACA